MTALPKCIATVALSGTLPDKLEAAAAVGFDGVEIMEADLLSFDGSPADVRRICEDLDLAVYLYQPFRDFEAMPEPQRARNMDRAERKFDVMQALGTDLTLVCSNTQAATIDDDARAAADLREMAERAARRGLRIGYEGLSWARYVRLWGHAWRIVQMADHPALGLIVDSFHTLSLGDDPAGIARVPADRLFFVQMADAPKLSMDVLSWSRHFRNFPGQGDLDVTGFMRAVLASGYSGPLSLEVFNDDFRSAPARLVARDGLRSLVLNEAEASDGAGLPAAPVLDGYEFLEFAVDETAGPELARFLKTLGFRHAGRHRSKAVDLYRQGGINLVLNAEQDSAAAEHFQLHGPSVCAMAIRVDDAARTLERAGELLCPEWQERIGSGERRIPAVRAPDGTLIYLIEPEGGGRSFWEDDFELLPDLGESAGLDAIDHVVLALPAGRMATYVLFWRGVFGLEPQPQLDTPDPYGLVQSRALISPNGKLRLVLNASESRATSTGRFVSAYSGAGVHHVAFSSSDIERTAKEYEARRAALLSMPINYYDDLSARWGLDDAALSALQLRGLLYDRDDAGEFWHLYTGAFRDRFFFEAVQRRKGYAGFGAANAPVRAAAQARQYSVVTNLL
nr:sugar phosphate isomerase/epimerase and 4-hydroxyphenylpyruvate domain-containing protein [uncultured Rhodopila sp.]